MKTMLQKLLAVSIIICLVRMEVYSQTYDLNTEFISRMNYVFGRIEKARVPYGLLLDYSMEFADIKSYNGLLSDTNKTNSGLIRDIYTTMVMSAIHSNAGGLVHPDYLDSTWQVQRQPGLITLCGLYYQYSRFRDDALSTGKLGVLNDQFYDRYINGIWQNPYQTGILFAMSPPLHAYHGNNIQVKLPANLWLTNNSSNVNNISVDFSDGLGFRTVVPNQVIGLTYADTGTRKWTFRLQLNSGGYLYSHTDMRILPDPSSTPTNTAGRFPRPGGPVHLIADEPFLGQFAEGSITVDYANADRRLRRPLIVAEGFDPGHILIPEDPVGYTSFGTFTGQVDSSGSATLFNVLRNFQLYDIIYVDWSRGTDFLQRNALLLERVIRWVNEQKVIDGSPAPNIVLGQSMGGVISRWALRDMEIKGLNHQVNLFISWDAPQLGAHAPLAYQHMGRQAASLYLQSNIPLILFGYNNIIHPVSNFYISGLNAIRSMFNGTPWSLPSAPSNSTVYGGLNLADVPAARQMLIYRLNWTHQLDNSVHDAWQQELRNRGYPLQCRNVAVSNGSECGSDQGYPPYATLLSLTGKANTRLLTDLIGQIGPFLGVILNKPQLLLGILPGRNDFTADFLCKAQPESGSQLLYRGKLSFTKKILWLVNVTTNITNRSFNSNPAVLPIDNTSGGFYDIADMGFNLTSSEFSNIALKFSLAVQNIPHFNFVPTPSALDIGGGNTTLTIADFRASYSGAAPPVGTHSSSFASFITASHQVDVSNGAFNNNEEHIEIAQRNGDWVERGLGGAPVPANNCTFVCNTAAFTITGPPVICTGPASYTLNGIPANLRVTWSSIPQGFVMIAPSPDGRQANVTRTTDGNFTLQATLTDPACGGTGTVSSPSIRAGNYSWSDMTIYGYPDVSCGQSYSYQVANVPGVYYTWTYPGNWYGYGQYTNILYVSVPSTVSPGQENISVSIHDVCSDNYSSISVTTSCGGGYYYYRMSPNPASSMLTVSLRGDLGRAIKEDKMIREVNIYDQQGNLKRRLKFNGVQTATLDVSGLGIGIYTLEIVDRKNRERQKLSIIK